MSILTVYSQNIKVIIPEEADMSSMQLSRLDSIFNNHVAIHKESGVVSIIARNGKVVHFEAYGHMDEKGEKSMQTDAIFRITSMTKTIISAAVMMLYDEGKIQLDDPVYKFIPEFKNLKVWNEGNPIPPKKDLTILHLLTKTAGFSSEPPLDKFYEETNLFDKTSKEMVMKLSKIPLMDHPGDRWYYGNNAYDVLGYIIEVVSGESLDNFLSKRIFQPLKMDDTGYFISMEKSNRLTTAFFLNEVGGLDASIYSGTLKPLFLHGESELMSTAEDYLKFALMLVNGGELEGVRLLRSTTVDLMSENHLSAELLPIVLDPSIPYYTQGYGYGLGFRVCIDVPGSGNLASEGMFGWGGFFSTFSWIDPKEKLVAILLSNVGPPSATPVNQDFQKVMYEAILK